MRVCVGVYTTHMCRDNSYTVAGLPSCLSTSKKSIGVYVPVAKDSIRYKSIMAAVRKVGGAPMESRCG